MSEKCKWTRAFDGHFNTLCPSGKRCNGAFKGKTARWDFIFCPYCGREIQLNEVRTYENDQQNPTK